MTDFAVNNQNLKVYSKQSFKGNEPVSEPIENTPCYGDDSYEKGQKGLSNTAKAAIALGVTAAGIWAGHKFWYKPGQAEKAIKKLLESKTEGELEQTAKKEIIEKAAKETGYSEEYIGKQFDKKFSNYMKKETPGAAESAAEEARLAEEARKAEEERLAEEAQQTNHALNKTNQPDPEADVQNHINVENNKVVNKNQQPANPMPKPEPVAKQKPKQSINKTAEPVAESAISQEKKQLSPELTTKIANLNEKFGQKELPFEVVYDSDKDCCFIKVKLEEYTKALLEDNGIQEEYFEQVKALYGEVEDVLFKSNVDINSDFSIILFEYLENLFIKAEKFPGIKEKINSFRKYRNTSYEESAVEAISKKKYDPSIFDYTQLNIIMRKYPEFRLIFPFKETVINDQKIIIMYEGEKYAITPAGDILEKQNVQGKTTYKNVTREKIKLYGNENNSINENQT